MGKNKVLVKVHPEGKYVVDLDKDIDIAQASLPGLQRDSYPCIRDVYPSTAGKVGSAISIYALQESGR